MRLSTADVLKLVPEFMRDDEAVKGLAAAVNKLIREPGKKVETVRVWDQIDELDDTQLDELAYELDIDWYSSSLPIENKRAVIKISDLVHSRRGTKWAVEALISAYLSPGFIEEWHEDGYINPKPFHFSVYTSHRQVTDAIIQEFRTIAKVAMPVRSRMDGVYFSDTYGNQATVGNTETVFFFSPKKCGTIPRLAVAAEVITDLGTIASNELKTAAFKSEEAGTNISGVYPRNAVVGTVLSDLETVATVSVETSNFEPREAGTQPKLSTRGAMLTKCGTFKCGE